MFLAHFSNWQHKDLMNLSTKDLIYWYTEAAKLYNLLNKAE